MVSGVEQTRKKVQITCSCKRESGRRSVGEQQLAMVSSLNQRPPVTLSGNVCTPIKRKIMRRSSDLDLIFSLELQGAFSPALSQASYNLKSLLTTVTQTPALLYFKHLESHTEPALCPFTQHAYTKHVVRHDPARWLQVPERPSWVLVSTRQGGDSRNTDTSIDSCPPKLPDLF